MTSLHFHLAIFAVLILCGNLCGAGELDDKEASEKLIPKSYRLPADLFEGCFSMSLVGTDYRQILERAGVTFGAGATAELKLGEPGKNLRNLDGDHELIVKNTEAQHELVQAYMQSLAGPSHERQVATIVEVIETDRASYQRWQFENSLDDTGDALRHFVQKKVRAGEARVLETLTVTARSGQTGTATSHSFEVYPTADNPALMLEEVKLTGAKAKLPDMNSGVTAWDCRDVGQRLEVEPEIRNNNTDVHLRLDLNITGRDEARRSVWPNQDIPDHQSRKMPTYDTRKVTTNVTVTHGGYALLAAWKPTDREAGKDRVQLVFVRADIMAIPLE